ncbi:MAG: hypothetical protein ACRCYY_21780 [Trueperaceae bacterium]
MKWQRRTRQWLKNFTVYMCVVGSLALYPGQLMNAQAAPQFIVPIWAGKNPQL